MKNLADKEDIYLLVSYERLLNETEKKDKLMKNIGILFTPEGNIGWEYVKAFPVAGRFHQENEKRPLEHHQHSF